MQSFWYIVNTNWTACKYLNLLNWNGLNAVNFGACMVITMKNIVKKLCVLKISCFAIHAILFQVASKFIINNFRGYFKVVLERAIRIYFPSLPFTMWSPYQCRCNGQSHKNKKVEPLFATWGYFIAPASLLESPVTVIAFKLSGFSNLNTFLIEIISSPKFWRIRSIGNLRCSFWFCIVLMNVNSC